MEGCRLLKRVAFLHGFLGSPNDMIPFFLKGAENDSIEYRDLLLSENTIEELSQRLEAYDILVGYSFGGRLLGEVKKLGKLKSKTWIFVSSRHSPYSVEQLKERELFRSEIAYLIQTDLQKFNDFWNELPLFSGHKMSDFREKYGMAFKPWSEDEKLNYLERFFNSTQFFPEKDESVHYIFGENDIKYSKEASALKEVFKTYDLKGVGHRAPFEDVESFKKLLEEIYQGVEE